MSLWRTRLHFTEGEHTPHTTHHTPHTTTTTTHHTTSHITHRTSHCTPHTATPYATARCTLHAACYCARTIVHTHHLFTRATACCMLHAAYTRVLTSRCLLHYSLVQFTTGRHLCASSTAPILRPVGGAGSCDDATSAGGDAPQGQCSSSYSPPNHNGLARSISLMAISR